MAGRRTCGDCRFRHEDQCRRYPPTVITFVYYDAHTERLASEAATQWPIVAHDEWCEEQRPRRGRAP